jgi:hypothetical protein
VQPGQAERVVEGEAARAGEREHRAEPGVHGGHLAAAQVRPQALRGVRRRGDDHGADDDRAATGREQPERDRPGTEQLAHTGQHRHRRTGPEPPLLEHRTRPGRSGAAEPAEQLLAGVPAQQPGEQQAQQEQPDVHVEMSGYGSVTWASLAA